MGYVSNNMWDRLNVLFEERDGGLGLIPLEHLISNRLRDTGLGLYVCMNQSLSARWWARLKPYLEISIKLLESRGLFYLYIFAERVSNTWPGCREFIIYEWWSEFCFENANFFS